MSRKPSNDTGPKSPPLSPPTSPSQRAFRIYSPPTSPPQNPTTSSRTPSVISVGRREQYFTPNQPSNLRNSTVPEISPHGSRERLYGDEDEWPSEETPRAHGKTSYYNDNDNADENTGLLGSPGKSSGVNPRRTFVRPGLHRNYDSFTSYMTDDGFGGAYIIDGGPERTGESEIVDSGILGDAITDGVLAAGDGNKMSTTKWLRKKHGIKGKRRMCVKLVLYLPE
jgi:hypothetical protein